MHYNIHTHHFSNNSDIVALVNQYPNEITTELPNFTVGIHPWYLNEKTFLEDLTVIENAIQKSNCKAIGERGLDKRIET